MTYRTTAHHRRRAALRGRALLLAAFPLLALAACSNSTTTSPAPSGKPTAHRAPVHTERTIDDAVQPALALVDEWIPEGFTDSGATSGHFWASDPASVDDSRPGRQLLQIACSGNGRITVKMTPEAPGRTVPCAGKAAGIPFSGTVHASVEGASTNRGVTAWRILIAT